jgi:type VI secretion system secreted protein Hcp
VASGLARVGLSSSPHELNRSVSGLIEVQVSGLLRNPTRASPLATQARPLHKPAPYVSYQPQKADGAKDGGAVKFGWNVRQNVKA